MDSETVPRISAIGIVEESVYIRPGGEAGQFRKARETGLRREIRSLLLCPDEECFTLAKSREFDTIRGSQRRSPPDGPSGLLQDNVCLQWGRARKQEPILDDVTPIPRVPASFCRINGSQLCVNAFGKIYPKGGDVVDVQLKMAFSLAATRFSVNERTFRAACGLRDFLIDGFTDQDPPLEVAAKALAYLVRHETPLYDRVVCYGVIDFLDEEIGAPVADANYQRLKDIWQMAQESASYAEYLKCLNIWYL